VAAKPKLELEHLHGSVIAYNWISTAEGRRVLQTRQLLNKYLDTNTKTSVDAAGTNGTRLSGGSRKSIRQKAPS
jgi:hypothetical protein